MMKGWRTVTINILTFIVSAAAWPQVVALIDPQVLLLVVAGINLFLRAITTTPIGDAKA